jgi:dTDP-4-dehydrorhamnose reductase
MKKVLVVGGSGMVASRFIELSKNKLDITSVDEKILDITDKKSVVEYFNNHEFEALINFAAYTNVDGAEKERGNENGFVWKLNVEGPKNLLEACKDKDIFFIQISTDFVFDGDGPFTENRELPNILNNKISWYGWTKNRGEVGDAIVRISYPFMAKEHDLKLDWAKNLIKLYKEQKLYPLFTDQIYSILNIDELVNPMFKIIDGRLTGIFHIVSNNTTTPYESGKYLLERYAGCEVEIKEGLLEEFMKVGGRAPRPITGGLATIDTEKKLGTKFKSWKEMIDAFVDQLPHSRV